MINHSIQYQFKKSSIAIITNQFGEVEINLEKQIHFPHGLIGMPEYKQFCLADVNNESLKYFKLLQGINDTKLAFLTLPVDLNNKLIDRPDLEEACKFLGIDVANIVILLIASAKLINDKKKIIVNVRAPVFIDSLNKIAVQYVISDNKYNIQHILE